MNMWDLNNSSFAKLFEYILYATFDIEIFVKHKPNIRVVASLLWGSVLDQQRDKPRCYAMAVFLANFLNQNNN